MRPAALAAKILIAHRAGLAWPTLRMIFEILLQILMQGLKLNWYQQKRLLELSNPSGLLFYFQFQYPVRGACIKNVRYKIVSGATQIRHTDYFILTNKILGLQWFDK